MHTSNDLKSQAKRLRKFLSTQNLNISHSLALEAVAAAHGFEDWNTATAAISAATKPDSKMVSPELYMALETKAGEQTPATIDLLNRFQTLASAAVSSPPDEQQLAEAMQVLGALGREVATGGAADKTLQPHHQALHTTRDYHRNDIGRMVVEGIKASGVLILGEEILTACLESSPNPLSELIRLLADGRSMGIELRAPKTGFDDAALLRAVRGWGTSNEDMVYYQLHSNILPAQQ